VDIHIMLRTVLLVLRREAVVSGARAEMDEFWGLAGPPLAGPRAYPVEENESIPS
jgi:hypothetical protein